MVGEVFKTNRSGELRVIKFVKNTKWDSVYKVEFLKTGTVKEATRKCIKTGSVKDPYFKNIYNVACLGNVSYVKNKKAYFIWNGMIRRCYDKNHTAYKSYGGKGVIVCNRWLCFEYFLQDIVELDGYDQEAFNDSEIKLDKDLKAYLRGKENNIYDKKSCVWLNSSDNNKLQIKKGQINIFCEKEGEAYIFSSLREFCRFFNVNSGTISRILNRGDHVYKNIYIKKVPYDFRIPSGTIDKRIFQE